MADYKTSNSNTAISNPLPSPLFTICFIIFLCILGIYIFRHPDSKTPINQSEKTNALYFQQLFISSSTNYTLSSYLRALTAHQHVAGTAPALQTLHYVETHLRQDLGLPTFTVEFDVLLSYPTHSSLTLHFKNGSAKDLSLTEPGQLGRVIDPYHAYSPSGSAHGRPVFANYGREEDYRALEVLGVQVKGCIVVVRRGGEVGRGEVVEVAAARGAVAVLTYTEGDTFSRGVERGTVMRGLGDPLTPGWAAGDGEGGGERLSVEDKEVKERFPAIPSMPISAENADIILRSLEGPRVPPEWRETVSSGGKVGRRAGAGPTLVNFTYQGEKKLVKIHDVFAVIRGWEEPDRYVLLGNHRDAWTYGGVDPNSGTAALLDIARRYSLLMRKGWAPRRTIVLCSWDAEEFGMVGSTEWVEQNLVNLGSKAVAYLNVDCAVQGPGLFASSTPQLDDLIVEVTKKIKDPDFEDMDVYQSWTATNNGVNIQRLSRVDSDFAPFLQHAGVPSVDLYYGEDYPVYHTAFDSYDWMIKYGDPLFHRHVAVAGIWGLLALRLADDPIIPFNYLSYATQLQEHTKILGSLLDASVSLHPIANSIEELSSAARLAEEEAKKLREVPTDNLLELKRRALNDRLMLAERAFTDADGLKGRQWFKHLIYGPPKEYYSKLSFFPGIADAISQATRMAMKEGQSAVQHEVWRVARAIQRAAIALRGELI